MKDITVFTDGSSRGNPGPGGWGVVIASSLNVYELSGQADKTTNNRMELTAALEALRFLKDHRQTDETIILYTDSQYFKNGFEKWMYGWQQKNWLTSKKESVLNQDLWQELLNIKPVFKNLKINYVRGHVGITGNERADQLATAAADKKPLRLYQGKRSDYPIRLDSVENISIGSSSKKGKAFCYLSIVDGQIMEHDNWDECKSRVSGKSNVKFRRANSAAERDQIIASWRK